VLSLMLKCHIPTNGRKGTVETKIYDVIKNLIELIEGKDYE